MVTLSCKGRAGGQRERQAGKRVSGTAAGAANTIADNGGAGVDVLSGTGNSIRGNSIFSNGNLGIHLNSANNANNNQAFPLLTSATRSASGTTISGTLTSTPSTTFDLDFFSNTTADPSGFGQGQTFLGTATATTDASGNANFTVTVSTPVPSGQPFISATATDPNGNTSEFAKDIHSGGLTATGTTVAATEGAAFTAVVANFTDSDTGVSSSNFTATIDWGDGSTSTGTITALPPSASGSNFQVTGSHTYTEEGSFTVTTKVHDTVDNLDATATSPGR